MGWWCHCCVLSILRQSPLISECHWKFNWDILFANNINNLSSDELSRFDKAWHSLSCLQFPQDGRYATLINRQLNGALTEGHMSRTQERHDILVLICPVLRYLVLVTGRMHFKKQKVPTCSVSRLPARHVLFLLELLFHWLNCCALHIALLFWLAMTPLLEMQLHATGAATHHKSCHLCRAGASFLLACLRKWWWRRGRREWRWEEDGAMSKDDFPIPAAAKACYFAVSTSSSSSWLSDTGHFSTDPYTCKSLLNALKTPCIHCLSSFCWIQFHELQRQHGLWLQTIESTDALWVYSDTPLKTAFFDSRWQRASDSSTTMFRRIKRRSRRHWKKCFKFWQRCQRRKEWSSSWESWQARSLSH